MYLEYYDSTIGCVPLLYPPSVDHFHTDVLRSYTQLYSVVLSFTKFYLFAWWTDHSRFRADFHTLSVFLLSEVPPEPGVIYSAMRSPVQPAAGLPSAHRTDAHSVLDWFHVVLFHFYVFLLNSAHKAAQKQKVLSKESAESEPHSDLRDV